MENTEFVSQLAQFRSLESNSNIEKAIGNLDSSFKETVDAQKYSAQSITNTGAVSLIGKSVRLRQTSVDYSAITGETEQIRVHLGNAQQAMVELLDSEGTVVRTLKAEGKDSMNSVNVQWDGTMDNGDYAAAGKYTIRIVGEDKNPALFAYDEDLVSGVRFTSEGAMVKVSGKELSISNIMDVSIAGSSGSSLDSLSPSTAVSLLGKEVRVRQSSVSYRQQDGEVATFAVNAAPNSLVKVDLLDASGNVVFTGNVYTNSYGVAEMSWSGETQAGTYAEAGEYRIRIDGEEKNPMTYAFYEGTVDGISNLGGSSRLRVDGYIVDLSDIIDIADAGVKEGSAV